MSLIGCSFWLGVIAIEKPPHSELQCWDAFFSSCSLTHHLFKPSTCVELSQVKTVQSWEEKEWWKWRWRRCSGITWWLECDPWGHCLLAAVLLIRLCIVSLFISACFKTSERQILQESPKGFIFWEQECVGMLPENILFKRSMTELEKVIIIWKGFVTYMKGSTERERLSRSPGSCPLFPRALLSPAGYISMPLTMCL